jgi:hypothetical protein
MQKYLFVDETRDTLDTTTTSKTANGRFGNSLYPISALSKENPSLRRGILKRNGMRRGDKKWETYGCCREGFYDDV